MKILIYNVFLEVTARTLGKQLGSELVISSELRFGWWMGSIIPLFNLFKKTFPFIDSMEKENLNINGDDDDERRRGDMVYVRK